MINELIIAIIGATATITAAVVTGIFKFQETRRKKLKNKSEEYKPITQTNLFEKELFSKSEYLINYTIKRLGFEHGNRSWIYEVIMKNKIESVIENTKHFLEENTLEEISPAKFEGLIFALISEIVKTYNEKTKNDFCKYYGENKGEKIFDMVMDKQPTKESPSMGFNVWFAPVITYMEKSVKDHCDSYYPNNIERMDAILDQFKCAISAAHTHLFKTFGNFNGELEILFTI